MRIERSIPFFTALIKAPNKNRASILKQFPAYVIDDLVEIIYNIIMGKVNIGRKVTKLYPYKKQLLKLKNARTKVARRKVILNQKGGLLPILLPIIGSVASSVIGSAVSAGIQKIRNRNRQ